MVCAMASAHDALLRTSVTRGSLSLNLHFVSEMYGSGRDAKRALETKCVAVSSVLPPGGNDPRNLPRAGESLLSFFFNVGVAV